LAWLACIGVLSACGDGIGVPIRKLAVGASPQQADGDAGTAVATSFDAGAPIPDSGTTVATSFDAAGPTLDAAGSSPADASQAVADAGSDNYCAPTAAWSPTLAAAETQLFEAINALRSGGNVVCGSRRFERATPFVLAPELQCSARLHSMDMDQRQFFNPSNPEGISPGVRMTRAGFDHGPWGEAIAWHRLDSDRVLQHLLADGAQSCSILADPRFTSIGIGYYGDLWTLDFAGR
jgi:uncharacterized protein YkwD